MILLEAGENISSQFVVVSEKWIHLENSSVKSFPASSHRTTEKKKRVAKENDEKYTSDLISRARSCARNDKFIILG